jgi:hypothetical protein
MTKSSFNSGSKDRKILLIVWLLFFIFNGAIILFLYLQEWIERDNFLAAIKQWNTSYAPYIGAITLFYWGSARKKQALKTDETRTAFFIAIIFSLIWNGIVLIFLFPPLLGTGAIETSLENIKEIVSLFSWLVAGAIGYYFTNPISKSN